MQSTRFTAPHLADLADLAERFALTNYERLPETRVLHNDSWALSLASHAKEIALRRPGATPDLPHLARALALLESCRYWGQGSDRRSLAEVAQEFRDWSGPDYLQVQLTLAATLPGAPGTLRSEVAEVLHDARLAQRILGGTDGAELSWLEQRYADGDAREQGPVREGEFLANYLEELRQARFHDGELRRRYQNTHSAVLLELQKLTDRMRRREAEGRRVPGTFAEPKPPTDPLAKLEEGPTRQAAQTYFRTAFRHQVQRSAIADRKAAIMISVNALLIGAIITFLSYRNFAQTRPELLFPVTIFVLCGLVSLVYAVLSARPSNTSARARKNAIGTHEGFGHLGPVAFRQRVERLLLDPAALYGEMIDELHGLGAVLDQRFGKLRIAYTVFLVGIVFSTLVIVALLAFRA